ncbi:unnamed protein product [Paramecium primaurelia]|uniref:Uncharacterized protein n=1 Tax=Paramecium primaurelia TaxID=5886 RepID=A0A8S1LSV3_PARPR|nr:unnamed protein product [Paramecium primaurelia]
MKWNQLESTQSSFKIQILTSQNVQNNGAMQNLFAKMIKCRTFLNSRSSSFTIQFNSEFNYIIIGKSSVITGIIITIIETNQLTNKVLLFYYLQQQLNIFHLNKKLGTILCIYKNSKKLTPIMNNPQEYHSYRSKLRRQIIQSNTQNEHSYSQQIKLEIQPSYDEIEIRIEKALKMMEKFEYKFCLGLGKYNQGIYHPKKVIKNAFSFGEIEIQFIRLQQFTSIQYSLQNNLFKQHKQKEYLLKDRRKIKISNIFTTKDYDEDFKCKLRLSQDNMKKIEGRHASEKNQLNIPCMKQENKNAMAAFLAEDQHVFLERIMTCRFYLNDNFNDGLYDGEL